MAYTPASSNTVTDAHGSNWLSLYSAELEPQVLREVYAKYGKGFDILDMLSLVGKEISLKSRGLPREMGYLMEHELGAKAFATEDAKEGPLAFFEKRKPTFRGL